MSTATDSLVQVATTLPEAEAIALVALLQEHGVRAIASGETAIGITSGTVHHSSVSVDEKDCQRAAVILKQHQSESRALNWDAVDVGQPVECDNEGEPPSGFLAFLSAFGTLFDLTFWVYIAVATVAFFVWLWSFF